MFTTSEPKKKKFVVRERYGQQERLACGFCHFSTMLIKRTSQFFRFWIFFFFPIRYEQVCSCYIFHWSLFGLNRPCQHLWSLACNNQYFIHGTCVFREMREHCCRTGLGSSAGPCSWMQAQVVRSTVKWRNSSPWALLPLLPLLLLEGILQVLNLRIKWLIK